MFESFRLKFDRVSKPIKNQLPLSISEIMDSNEISLYADDFYRNAIQNLYLNECMGINIV